MELTPSLAVILVFAAVQLFWPTTRRLALVWGVNPVLCHDVMSVDEMTEVALKTVSQLGFADPGHAIVIAAGMPFGTPGTTNLLRISQVV